MTSKKSRESIYDSMTDEERKKWHAKVACRASANGAVVTMEYGGAFGEQDVNALVAELGDRAKKLAEGDMSGVEAMLYAQAHALQSIFVNLSRRAAKQDYLKQFGTYLGLALKAQAQCRATLETLAELKNPKPSTFVRQQNVAYQQQVNNGAATNPNNETNTHAPARTEKTLNQSNELLEAQHGERLDSGTTGTTSGINSDMATVEAINRPTDRAR